MIVDASALIAILREDRRRPLVPRRSRPRPADDLSAANFLETAIVNRRQPRSGGPPAL